MINTSLQMRNGLDDADRMVVALKTLVRDVLVDASLIKFEICTSEALTNLVKHASTTDKSEPIRVELIETTDAITLGVFDPIGAQPFDLRDNAQPLDDVDPLAESGRGLGLIMQCADHADYGPKGDHMCLSLTFLKSGD